MLLSTACSLTSRFNAIVVIVGVACSVSYQKCNICFCSTSFLKLLSQGAGISGIKIHRITRVHNRILRTQFDDKLDKILDNDDITELAKYEHFDIL